MKVDLNFASEISNSNLFFIFILVLYVLLGIYLFRYYQYDLISKDIISFVSVANLYAYGDLYSALNGYWGPLFSWLLLPFILLNSSPYFVLYSMKIISLVVGIFTIYGVRLLSYRFEMEELTRNSILFAIIFMVLYFALRSSPVDLLFVCFLVYYLYFIFSPRYSFKPYYGVVCGVIGALAYLTKSYAFTFFLAHFIFFNIIHYYSEVKLKKNVLKNLFLGLTVFLIISGTWSLVLSEKYGEVTFGTSGKYNYYVIGPNSTGAHPTEYINQGFMKPPYEGVTSAWYDPTFFQIESWNPLESWANLIFQLNKIRDNILGLVGLYSSFSYLSLLIIFAYILFLIRPIKELISRKDLLFPLLTVLIFPLGYLAIALEMRYLWIIYVLLILMGGYLINLLLKNNIFNKAQNSILLVIFVISFLLLPISGLTTNKYDGKDYADLGHIINDELHIKGNIASNGNADNGNYRRTLHLSYFLGTAYYGFPKNGISDDELEFELEKYDIDYYFVWGKTDNEALLSKYREVSGGKIQGLRIYSIN